MGYLKYKGYSGSVEYSEEDKCLFGKVQGMAKDSITYEGATVEELTADFEGAIDDYLALCAEKGIEPRKPYTGVLNVRLTPEIHSNAAIAAQKAGITINAFIKEAVAKALGMVL
ncbi:Predicted nuclease of the RNAse H fold, HicB family [Xylanibacter ruminicola]|uniref:Predicted nuclease of the RNAse H fold, HicB family n=1 Tax=Xylanibacter ruminicola TaxID=839 RepID=A0A1M7NGS2_XYLRU|nr:type II toxin-antitoxin system HicB family antitoxin [Xylanibacter ruminicola]SFC69546.1 Predicted nuclease of the RNAse H fold, HicB family [Xylanibacter ruminicola]SHN02648.1 Predicted nuclease of the RNAse H fold, HicB family [Xylanibacter ruminicola]